MWEAKRDANLTKPGWIIMAQMHAGESLISANEPEHSGAAGFRMQKTGPTNRGGNYEEDTIDYGGYRG
jgi:hypothetical protein